MGVFNIFPKFVDTFFTTFVAPVATPDAAFATPVTTPVATFATPVAAFDTVFTTFPTIPGVFVELFARVAFITFVIAVILLIGREFPEPNPNRYNTYPRIRKNIKPIITNPA